MPERLTQRLGTMQHQSAPPGRHLLMEFIDLGPYEYLFESLSHLAGTAACNRATCAAYPQRAQYLLYFFRQSCAAWLNAMLLLQLHTSIFFQLRLLLPCQL